MLPDQQAVDAKKPNYAEKTKANINTIAAIWNLGIFHKVMAPTCHTDKVIDKYDTSAVKTFHEKQLWAGEDHLQ